MFHCVHCPCLLIALIYAQAFAQLLQAPHDDAQIIIRDRFPVPRLVVCDQHGSQVKYLYRDLCPFLKFICTSSTIYYQNFLSLTHFVW